MAEAEALAERAVGALLDDETLRGDLTDDGFAPLLEWATNALTAVAQRVADAPDAEAETRMEAAGAAVKETLAAAVQAAQAHSRRDVLALAGTPLVARNTLARGRVLLAGFRLGDDPDANARQLARLLRDVGASERGSVGA
jgi:hypothetical protein